MFGQHRSFTVAAIATLGLGMGANTAIFSVVNTVMLKPVPFPEPDRLVMFMGPAASPAKFQHWRAQTTVVQDVAAYRTNLVNHTSGAFPEQLRAGHVSADYFRLFGAPVFQGRTFSEEEDRPNGERVVVLSHGLWLRRFAGDPAVVGSTISLDGEPYAVIGIIGPSFDVTSSDPRPSCGFRFSSTPIRRIRAITSRRRADSSRASRCRRRKRGFSSRSTSTARNFRTA